MAKRRYSDPGPGPEPAMQQASLLNLLSASSSTVVNRLLRTSLTVGHTFRTRAAYLLFVDFCVVFAMDKKRGSSIELTLTGVEAEGTSQHDTLPRRARKRGGWASKTVSLRRLFHSKTGWKWKRLTAATNSPGIRQDASIEPWPSEPRSLSRKHSHEFWMTVYDVALCLIPLALMVKIVLCILANRLEKQHSGNLVDLAGPLARFLVEFNSQVGQKTAVSLS